MLQFFGISLLTLTLGITPVCCRTLAPGLDLGELHAPAKPVVGDSTITILRIDPDLWTLEFAGISQSEGSCTKNTREWCEAKGFLTATNAGTFKADYRTHVGHMRSGGHVNSGEVNHYNSVAAYGPRKGSDLPAFRIFDRDAPGGAVDAIVRDCGLVAQSLRLIKRPGQNAWGERERSWSEDALGEDSLGRILFIFCRSAYNMHRFAELLLESDLGIVAAQHLEGGPAAQMFVRVGEFETGFCGSYETDFREDDSNVAAWPVPNVLGVRSRVPGE